MKFKTLKNIYMLIDKVCPFILCAVKRPFAFRMYLPIYQNKVPILINMRNFVL
jgi:hypothetical protein